MADDASVSQLTNRTKRYQDHQYTKVRRLAERVERATQSSGNAEYRRAIDELGARHRQKKIDELNALSLFSGCGGLSLGFSAAGFQVKGFLEIDNGLRKIYRSNFPESLELGGDIADVNHLCVERFYQELGAVDVIFGGPPCQGFSLSGKRQVDDPRNALFEHYLRFVKTIKPKIAVLENVRLLTSMKNSSGDLVKDDIDKAFEAQGYKVKCFEVNAKNYGVPQHRERIIFIAVRDDLKFSPSFPSPTHGETTSLFSEISPCRTFADACSDLPFIESGEPSEYPLHEAVNHPSHVINWLWDVPQGKSAHGNEDEQKRPPSGYNTTYKRQIWDEPASTVQTTFGMISGCRNVHPIATRSLTIREAARIQSFPDSYAFEGSLGTIRTGIGNAVPPLLSFQIALHLKKCLLNLVEVS